MISAAIIDEIRHVLLEQGGSGRPVEPGDLLSDLNVNSLILAVLVTRLEDRLGIDPFSSLNEIEFPLTVGGFVDLYEQAALHEIRPCGLTSSDGVWR